MSPMINALKKLPEVGELFYKYAHASSKTQDQYVGPLVALEQVGNMIVKGLNLDTMRSSVVHINDIRNYERPSVLEWKSSIPSLNNALSEFDQGLDLSSVDYSASELGKNWHDKTVFADISCVSDLEEIFLKAIKELPKFLVVIIPQWKEKLFWMFHELIVGDYVPFNDFEEGGNPVGRLAWVSWLGIITQKHLKDARKLNLSLSSLSSHLGELWKQETSEEDQDISHQE